MNKIIKLIIVLFLVNNVAFAQKSTAKINVIVDTDMGNDVDDALAIDMLFKYMDDKKVNLLAISNVKNNKHAVPYLDLFKRWYGYSNVPLFTIKPIIEETTKKKRFTEIVSEYKEKGEYVFKRKVKSEAQVLEAIQGLRKVLSKQDDNSVVFISLGYLTNLSNLLKSGPDKYSNLNGEELVKRKVKHLSMMGGDFRGVERTEFNIRFDVAAAQNVFEKWPTDIFISPYEVGLAIKFPAKVIESDLKFASSNPLVMSYENYLKMPYDRESWDLTSVLFAIEGKNYFDLSPRGTVQVVGKGKTIFTENKDGKHTYLKANDVQQKVVLDRLIELVVQRPKNHKIK